MCTFRLLVEMCYCNDIECSQINPDVQDDKFDNVESGGHVIRVVEYYRISGVCMDWFINEDPDRMMVKQYGMDPLNGNSKQDCKNKVFKYDKERYHSESVCEACVKNCTQPGQEKEKSESPELE
ncbi:unnamed protein product [Clonostachys byssicola]|uniref:Uncharacterized protein n=1 Tax=Clonostachys byssicola TaxID=160290 RepID=A0A9N9TYQ8_9HYPO|nr:unnamed protein product [Clonostachys byssicola]